MLTKAFWLATAERAVKTFAQAVLALFIGGATVITIDWQQVIALGGTAAVISILTSVISSQVGPEGSPSVVPDPQPPVVYVGQHEAPVDPAPVLEPVAPVVEPPVAPPVDPAA
jgi:hypothetical protein